MSEWLPAFAGMTFSFRPFGPIIQWTEKIIFQEWNTPVFLYISASLTKKNPAGRAAASTIGKIIPGPLW
jgi:hypothetical protein